MLSGYFSACEKLFSSSSEFTWIIPGLRAWVPPPSPQYCGVFKSFTNCSFSKLSWTGNRCRPRREGREGETERVRGSEGKGRFSICIIFPLQNRSSLSHALTRGLHTYTIQSRKAHRLRRREPNSECAHAHAKTRNARTSIPQRNPQNEKDGLCFLAGSTHAPA